MRAVTNPFFERPILNSPYEYPRQHWELDESGQPTGNLIERRRRAEFITPIPKPKKRRGGPRQGELVLDEVVSASQLVEWEVPREAPADWPETAKNLLTNFWDARIARQKAIDASIAAKADFEYLHDRPYVDPKTVRVAGPFTVESLSPHRTLGVDENDELIDPLQVKESGPPYGQTFEQMILDNLRAAGVQQAHKADRITFTSLTPWPGEMVGAEGRFREGDVEKRAAIFIGPEFGTVSRPDLVQAAREAGDAGFDVLIACAFNYQAHASEFNKLGRIPILKARMNADLHMGGELKPTGKGNLFVVSASPTSKSCTRPTAA